MLSCISTAINAPKPSAGMVHFSSGIARERDGRCRALHYNRQKKTFLRCDDGAQRTGHSYCYNCWLALWKVGREEFPPRVGGRETRAAIGEQTIFVLSRSQMDEYRSREAPRAVNDEDPSFVSLSARDEIQVATRLPHPAWAVGDKEHTGAGRSFAVYVVRVGDGSLYIGQTRKQPAHRFGEHQAGTGSRHLKERGIFGDRPVWSVQVSSRELAMQLEQCLLKAFRSLDLNASIGETDD